MTLISRILGLARDIIIAKLFGVSAALDAFIIAFKIPNFLRRLFAEGSFSQAIMPILAQSKGDANEQEVINHITGRLFVILFCITFLVVLFSPIVVFVFAPNYYFERPDDFTLTSNLLKITFPYLLFISLTAFFGSILNNNKRFAVAAFTPALLNASLIASALFLRDFFTYEIYALAVGVFVGGMVQLLLQVPFLLYIGKFPRPSFKSHPVFSDVHKRMLPALFSTSITQINLLIDTIIATTLITGSVSWLYYANRLLEFPIALIGVALGIVGIAHLSHLHTTGDTTRFKTALSRSLQLALIFGLPSTIGLVYLSEPIMTTLFYYGDFSLTDLTNSATALSVYALAALCFIGIKVMTPAFLATGNTKTPVKVGVIALGVNIILNIILSYYYSFLGIAMATVVYAIVNMLGLLIMLHTCKIYQWTRAVSVTLVKVSIASVGMLSALLLTNSYFEPYYSYTLTERMSALGLELSIAVITYFLILFILKQKVKLV